MLFDRKHKSTDAVPPPPAADEPVTRRRNKLAGMWAAELLGLIGHAAQDYARELAHAHENTPDEHVVHKLAGDLKGKVSAHEIREKLAHFLHEAKRQIAEHRGKKSE
ncbi:MAG: ATPase inhibitor subunit zeta [Actinomycetota bacterium]